jgi:hypothetical protein
MERISKVLQLDIADSTKAKHLIILCKEHPELYESITDLLIDHQQNSLLSLFLTEYDDIGIKRKISKLRGSKWTYEQLDYFKIDFQDTSNTEDICPTSQINEDAQRFLHDNKDIDGYFELTEESQISSVINTAFKGYLLYVQKSPSVESCVDDAVRELLQQTLGNNFLVKTRYDMTLSMSNGSTKATADVLAIFIPKLYMGVIIVEDKPHETSKTNEQHSDAEAQMVAEALAIVQQKRWPLNKPIFMLRVLETNITFYKACFTNELISSVTKGQRRLDPFLITRLEYRNPLFTNDRPGYNVLKRKDREIIVSILSNIGYHISHMF